MATVVRLKRRRDEDPLDILELAFKKQKANTEHTEKDVSVEKTSFKFAGTVDSKDAKVSKHVREAIRKDKLEREYKQHQINILGELREMTRLTARQKSSQNRFKVKANYRALKLDSLDNAANKDSVPAGSVPSTSSHVKTNGQDSVCELCGKIIQVGLDSQPCQCAKPIKSESAANSSKTNADSNIDTNMNAALSGTLSTIDGAVVDSKECLKQQSEGTEDDKCKFCLVDMEADADSAYQSAIRSCSSDQISCNSQRMVHQVVVPPDNDTDYVYDLYYTNSRDFDFRMFESNLMLEAYGDDLLPGRGLCEDDFVEEDDDDDENAETNWRNDYPEEDPGFLENEDVEYEYGEGMDDCTAFEPSNELAEWMTWKCHVEDEDLLSSDEDAVDRYETAGTSFEAYYRKVHKELADHSESDDAKEKEESR